MGKMTVTNNKSKSNNHKKASNNKKESKKKNLHIQIGICSHHEGQHVHCHNKLHQHNSHASEIVHTRITEEAYYQSHHWRPFEATIETKLDHCLKPGRKEQKEGLLEQYLFHQLIY